MKGMLWPDDVPLKSPRSAMANRLRPRAPADAAATRAKKKAIGAGGPPSEPKRAVQPKPVERAPKPRARRCPR